MLHRSAGTTHVPAGRMAMHPFLRRCVVAVLMASFAALCAATATAGPVETLRAKQASLSAQLASNAFHQPLVLESTQVSGDLQGDVYAVVEHPFNTVEHALQGMGVWCDILILHLNVKQCKAAGSKLDLSVGKKYDQPAADAYQVSFAYQLAAATPDYLRVQLSAKDGPLGTSDYRILLEATPLDARHSFIHMSYAYASGFAARMAMQAYLATAGSSKVGFSIVGKKSDGSPVYVGNVRGVIERNTMRYYLAIDGYRDSLSLPAAQQQEKRLHDWYGATERYRQQLHEMEEADYMAMKRKEIARQQAS